MTNEWRLDTGLTFLLGGTDQCTTKMRHLLSTRIDHIEKNQCASIWVHSVPLAHSSEPSTAPRSERCFTFPHGNKTTVQRMMHSFRPPMRWSNCQSSGMPWRDFFSMRRRWIHNEEKANDQHDLISEPGVWSTYNHTNIHRNETVLRIASAPRPRLKSLSSKVIPEFQLHKTIQWISDKPFIWGQ